MAKIKVAIITTSDYGTASHHLEYLIKSDCCDVVQVIRDQGKILNKKRFYTRKFKKILKIGLIGAFLGIHMRRWYDSDVLKNIKIENLKSICDKNSIPYEAVDSINSNKAINILSNINAELGLSLGNGYISKKIFTIFKYGMINIHHELLPDYQNASSIIWQIYNGSKHTGFTIHKINNKIDQGDILFKEKVDIQFHKSLRKTVSATFTKVLGKSAKGLIYVLSNFDQICANAQPQSKGKSYTTPSFFQYVRILKEFRKLRNTLVSN